MKQTHFTEPHLQKKCAIIDGTYLGKFIKEVLFIPGKTDFILNFNTIVKRGDELDTHLLVKTLERLNVVHDVEAFIEKYPK